MAILARDPETGRWGNAERNPTWAQRPGVLAVGTEGPLFYANAVSVKDRIHEHVRRARPALGVLELSESGDLDVGTLDMLAELAGELAREGVELRFAAVRRPVQELMRRSGLAEHVRIELTIDAAAEAPHVPAVGGEAERQRKPVPEEPVGEGGEDGVPGAHAGE